MVFSTPLFLYIFLPIALVCYYLTPAKFRNVTLLLSSLLFYFWGEQIFVLIMFASIFIDYFHGLMVSRFKEQGKITLAKCMVASSILFNLGLLGFFKYWDFFAQSFQSIGLDFMPLLGVHLPIGISFYTFQTMSYTIDVYRGDAKAQKNILSFGAFVTLFPQLIAGPILKYKELGEQLDHREHTYHKFTSGIQIFIIGLAKKVLIANAMGQLWESYRDIPTTELTVLGAWLGAFACGLQIYFDFCGYSDMAVGLGRMMGFQFSGNFNYPYISTSITDFWRRWHISLSSWFREYLYIPLGGNRCSRGRVLLNLLIVWLATGFWHGASWNFILWGLFFFVVLMLEKEVWGKSLASIPLPFRHSYTIILLCLSWIIFSIEDLTNLGAYLQVMLGMGGVPLLNGDFLYLFHSNAFLLLIACIGSTPIPAKLFGKLEETPQQILGAILLLLGLLTSTAYVVDATYNPFLYFRF